MPFSHSSPPSCQWFSQRSAALDRRSAVRLALVFIGADLALGRRTITTRYLVTGYHGPWWTPEELLLLGTAPGEEAALRTGLMPSTVRQQRERGGLPRPLVGSANRQGIRGTRRVRTESRD